MKKCKVFQDAMDATFKLGKLIEFSPKSDAIFIKQSELSPRDIQTCVQQDGL